MAVTLNFNASAAQTIGANEATKLRLDSRDGVLFVRPTQRKAGPHALVQLNAKASGRLSVEIDDAVVERLGLQGLDVGQKFSVIQDRYGWYAIQPGEDHEKANGAKATLSRK